jgi:predicted CXXCH cytochrome family protein
LASGTDLHPERFDGRALSFGALRLVPERRAGKPVFRIRDGAGERIWAVTGTVGVAPLQQYLLEHTRGRVLVAPVAWDISAGRWFDPAPDGVAASPKDALYWAGMAGNWNHLCGECHTTGYDKGYRVATDSYASSSVHPVVACEACHGAGPAIASLRDGAAQIRACAPCHSRHETLAYGGGPASELLDTIRPALIDDIAFQPDGRNSAPEEPFEWGAFSQSKMYRRGVRCSDCHDPHTGRTRGDGDAVCARCHINVAAQHPPGADSSACIACHMPVRAYMGIHLRHDHGIRVPGRIPLGDTWIAARSGDPSAEPRLLSLAFDSRSSGFIRASAVRALRAQRPEAVARVRGLLADPDALLRAEVTETLAAWGEVPVASLSDPSKAVRFAALKSIVLMGAAPALRAPVFDAVRREFEATTQTHGDLAATWQNVGSVREVTGDAAGASRAYEEALRLEPDNAWLNGRVRALRAKR